MQGGCSWWYGLGFMGMWGMTVVCVMLVQYGTVWCRWVTMVVCVMVEVVG